MAGEHRLSRERSPSVLNYQGPLGPEEERPRERVTIDCGWGRLIIGHTYANPDDLIEELRRETPGRRDLALYLRDPHVVLALAPQELFLDPSHTYRLWLTDYRPARESPRGLVVRRIQNETDIEDMNRIYLANHMVPMDAEPVLEHRTTQTMTYWVAEHDGAIVGAVVGVDHVHAFDDFEQGTSLWSLAVDPVATLPGLGERLVRQVVEHFQARGRAYVDLSVMHDNVPAIRLYERLGFRRVPVFCVKRRNEVNEPLFAGPGPESELNPYAMIIVREAQRRGIALEVIDAAAGYFELKFGGRTVRCRESLTDLTSAVAMSLCADKATCTGYLRRLGLRAPQQRISSGEGEDQAFLAEVGSVVVKPCHGEQGKGVAVDVRAPDELRTALARARAIDDTVLLEEYVEGSDLRIVVIAHEVVAAAVRHAPQIVGTGRDTARTLIKKLSRRRQAATGGESRIPLDAETERCLALAGFEWDDIIPNGTAVRVRRTANLHTGGILEDVTDRLHPSLSEAAVAASQALDIPVVGLDFIINEPDESDFVFIEANERPGLANHEPQPTAERFIDLLFPQTVA